MPGIGGWQGARPCGHFERSEAESAMVHDVAHVPPTTTTDARPRRSDHLESGPFTARAEPARAIKRT